MQCPSCRFENMPGATNCGRCGGTLRAAVAVDVHPPRASQRAKFWRRSLPNLGRSRVQVREGVESALSTVLGSWRPSDVRASGVFRRMIIPGWAQIHCRHRLRGQLLMLAWLACLMPGLIFAGTGGGSFLVGLAIAIHCISALDIILVDSESMLDRMGRGALALVIINGLIYFPLGRLIGLVASPQTILQDTDRFAPGTVVLVNNLAYRSSEPQVGDIVLYDLPEFSVADYARHARYEIRGVRLDRILASGGQHVVFKEGQLTVNGTVSGHRPLSVPGMPATFDVTVPPNSFLIVPSLDGNLMPEFINDVALIERSRIYGQAWWQTQPLSEFGPLN